MVFYRLPGTTDANMEQFDILIPQNQMWSHTMHNHYL